MKKLLNLALLYFVVQSNALGQVGTEGGFIKSQVNEYLAKESSSLEFIENKGQWDAEAHYLARLNSGNLWLTQTGVRFDVYEASPIVSPATDAKNKSKEIQLKGQVFDLSYLNSNKNVWFTNEVEKEGYFNYMVGSDSKKHASFVKRYERVLAHNVFKGIDVQYYANEMNEFEYDFIVSPYANPNQIAFTINGSEKFDIINGELVVFTRYNGEVKISKPIAYQLVDGEKRFVKVTYSYQNGVIGFSLPEDYNHTIPLTIDPSYLVANSTYIGYTYDVKKTVLDNQENIYVVGSTSISNPNYPSTTGAYQINNAGGDDGYISKLSANCGTLIFSTFVGSNTGDWIYDVKVDNSNRVYFCGETTSASLFAAPINGVDNTFSGITEGFFACLNSTGSALLFKTFLGGSDGEKANALHIVAPPVGSNTPTEVYVTGDAYSTDYPTTSGAFDVSHNGNEDAFITRLSLNFSTSVMTMVASTYFGSSTFQLTNDISVLGGLVFIAGSSGNGLSTTLPSVDPTFNGGTYDGYIAVLTTSLNTLKACTYIGGSNTEFINDIEVSSILIAPNTYQTMIHLVGETESPNFPITPNAFDDILGGTRDAFLCDIRNDNLNFLSFSTFLGGSDIENGISVDFFAYGGSIPTSYVAIAGVTYSTNFPLSTYFLRNNQNAVDGYFTILTYTSTTSSLNYSSYIGGNQEDYTSCVLHKPSINGFVIGSVSNSSTASFPNTTGGYKPNKPGATTTMVSNIIILTPQPNPEERTATILNDPFSNEIEGKIYPNPAKDQVKIAFSDDLDLKTVEFSFWDINGKQLDLPIQYEGQEAVLDVMDIKEGIYFVLIKSHNKQVYQKFVVAR